LIGKRIAQAACVLLLVSGCATVTPDLPAITEAPTGNHDSGRVVWHDLLTTTPEESRKFYGELFGWEFEKPASFIGVGEVDSYMLILHNGKVIGGMMDANVLERDEDISQWVTVMSVGNIGAAVSRVRSHGGEVLTPPTDVGSRGTLAVIASPDKAILALLEAREGDPGESEPEVNGWLWNELWTNDVQSATEFFTQVSGLQHEDHTVEDTGKNYRVLKSGDVPRVAVLDNPFEGVLPVWVNYLRVADPAAITARVGSLGGRVLVEAQPRSIGGTVAFVSGPSGAGIALQTWPLHQKVEQE
jgi:predicted enzyme related to lactoylglutathione lyase